MAEDAEDRHQGRVANRQADTDEARRADDQEGGDSPPAWEWGVALLGLALVLSALGFITYQAFTGDDSPPDVRVHVDGIVPLDHGYLVQFRAVNQGGSTAAQVEVEGELRGENGQVERHETVIDYVPSHSYRNGGLFFSQHPGHYPLTLRAKGYAEP